MVFQSATSCKIDYLRPDDTYHSLLQIGWRRRIGADRLSSLASMVRMLATGSEQEAARGATHKLGAVIGGH